MLLQLKVLPYRHLRYKVLSYGDGGNRFWKIVCTKKHKHLCLMKLSLGVSGLCWETWISRDERCYYKWTDCFKIPMKSKKQTKLEDSFKEVFHILSIVEGRHCLAFRYDYDMAYFLWLYRVFFPQARYWWKESQAAMFSLKPFNKLKVCTAWWPNHVWKCWLMHRGELF